MTISVKRVVVTITDGTDLVSIYPEGLPTAFPEMKYPVCLRMEARKGYGVQWCREVLGLEPEVLEVVYKR